MQTPSIDRPDLPPGYGEGVGDPLPWDLVESRLVAATHYWLSSTYPDGRPHVMPRWGVWLKGAFWYDGSPQTRHALNVEENDRCVLHLEGGQAATIVEGSSEASAPIAADFGESLSVEFCRKYQELGYAPKPDAWSDDMAGGLRVLTPIKVIAWSSFPGDITRFTFEESGP